MLWGTPRAMACDAKGTAYAGRKRFSLQRPLLEQQIPRYPPRVSGGSVNCLSAGHFRARLCLNQRHLSEGY